MVLRVDSWDAAPADAVKVALFRGPKDDIRGWFLSPLIVADGTFHVFCEAKSRNLLAAAAVAKAHDIASRYGLPLCIVDPDNLWDDIWGHP